MTLRRVPVRDGRWTMRDIVLMAALAVIFGVIYWAVVQAWGVVRAALGPAGDLAQHIFIGAWFAAAPLAIYIIRKPLTGIVTEVTAAFIEFAFLGSPVGPILLLTGFIQGAGSELPFAISRYRHFGWVIFALSGLSAAIFSFVYNVFRLGWLGQTPPGITLEQLDAAGLGWLATIGVLAVVRLAVQSVSGIVLGGLLPRVLGDALLRTGVLDNFAIGRAAQVPPEPTLTGGGRAWGWLGLAVGGALLAFGSLLVGQLGLAGPLPTPDWLPVWRSLQFVALGVMALGVGSLLAGWGASRSPLLPYGLMAAVGGVVVAAWCGLAAGQPLLVFQPVAATAAALQVVQSIAAGVAVLGVVTALAGALTGEEEPETRAEA